MWCVIALLRPSAIIARRNWPHCYLSDGSDSEVMRGAIARVSLGAFEYFWVMQTGRVPSLH